MATAWAVDMVSGMATALVVGRAPVGVLAVSFQSVLVDVIAVHMMEMAVMQVVDMPRVFDGSVAAARLVLMVMVRVLVAGAHFVLL